MVGKSEKNRISHGLVERLHKQLYLLLIMLVPLSTNLVVLLTEVEGR
jgi:hypothetical protein